MSVSLQEHLEFWRTIEKRLTGGWLLPQALNDAKAALAGTELAQVAADVAAAVEGGKAFSDALAQQPGAFSRVMVAMVRAGEAGGVVEAIARRIVEGIEDGSMPLPGVSQPHKEMVRYWRAFGHMLSSGVPLVEVLRTLREEVAAGELAEATELIEQGILKGQKVSSAMRNSPKVFPNEMSFAVEMAEDGGNLDEQAFRIADALEARDLGSLITGKLEHVEELAPARLFANTVMLAAIQKRASDIHIDPTESGRPRVRLRMDGVLHDIEWPKDVKKPAEVPYGEVVSRVKVMAGMDIAERRLPQDGRIQLNIGGRPVDVRVSTVPTVHGERVVMRILMREDLSFDVAELGMLEDDLDIVRKLCRTHHGTVLCAGPTGSGKTTLFYAMLKEFDADHACIMSVEDPVEDHLEGVAQINVNPQIGRTFARTVRHVLRQDPDVILIGEIRDTEVANLAAQCALTGHVVLTTLHAATAPGGIKRLVDMGVEPFVVNASLAGVISQRLVRILCPECKQEVRTPTHSLPPEAVELVESAEGKTFYAPKGCSACNGTGYRGRIAIHEILIPDDGVKNVVAAGGDLAGIREAAIASGMRTMLACGIENAARGITSIEEVLRVIPAGPNE